MEQFFRALRAADVRVSPAEAIDAARAMTLTGFTDRELFKDSLCATLAKSADEVERFDLVFETFFTGDRVELPPPPQEDGEASGGAHDADSQPEQGAGSPLAQASDGSFMVVTDGSTSNGGGGRLIIFHNEPFAIPTFSITAAARVAQGFQLNWQSAGAAKYRVQRGTTIDNLQDITGDLTVTQFTDTNNVGNVFYRVVAKP